MPNLYTEKTVYAIFRKIMLPRRFMELFGSDYQPHYI